MLCLLFFSFSLYRNGLVLWAKCGAGNPVPMDRSLLKELANIFRESDSGAFAGAIWRSKRGALAARNRRCQETVNFTSCFIDHMAHDLPTVVNTECLLQKPGKVCRNESVEVCQDSVLPEQGDRRGFITICILREASYLSFVINPECLTNGEVVGRRAEVRHHAVLPKKGM